MKSVILDLDEDLTNEQIDAIINKLQSKKKVLVPEVAVLTKAENAILNKIRKHVKPYSYSGSTYDPKDFDAESYRKFVVEHIIDDMDNMDNDIHGELGCCKESIEENLDRINEAKREIAADKKDLVKWQNKIKEHKEMYKVVKQLEKEFAKAKK